MQPTEALLFVTAFAALLMLNVLTAPIVLTYRWVKQTVR